MVHPGGFAILIVSHVRHFFDAEPVGFHHHDALMYGYLIAVIIDVWLMWRKLKAKLIAKYGERSVSKGSRSFSYAWSRSIQMRRWSFPSRVTRSAVTGRRTDCPYILWLPSLRG